MSTAKQVFGSISAVILTIIILNKIISVRPSAFSDFPISIMTSALILAIPTGALSILGRLRGL